MNGHRRTGATQPRGVVLRRGAEGIFPGAAVARMRRVQEQAWTDHDADDERERSVLALVLGESAGTDKREGGKREERERASGCVMARYQSQRSQYLRVILDAEREIARLRGLYESGASFDGAVVFRLERVESGVASTSRTRNVSVEADKAADEDGDSGAGG